MRHSLNQTELDEIQRRTATLMGTTGAEQVRNATSIDFYATCMFLAGAFHSTDHGICNAVVLKYKFPAFSTSPYGSECKPWDRECLVISDNFRRIAIANIGKEFYKSINHRQDLIKPLHELKGHSDALKRLNQSLELAKHELCAYVGVDSFHIYPSVSH
jgi:alcohol dehydrogenase class IV